MQKLQGALISRQEAPNYVGIPLRGIDHLIYTRQIPVVRIGRRTWLRRTDLDALVANGTQK